jgi:hypothetical protein
MKRRVVATLAASCAGILLASGAWAAGSCKVSTWDLAADWSRSLNRSTPDVPDACGKVVWSFFQGSSTSFDPATFTPMDIFQSDTAYACTPAGANLQGWASANGGAPAIAINATGLNQDCDPWAPITLEAGIVDIHPGPSAVGGVSWKSPFKGTAKVEVSLGDLDPWGTYYDGVTWAVEKNATILGQGEIANAGSNVFTAQVKVLAGDTIHVAVGPGSSYVYDSTLLKLKITRVN